MKQKRKELRERIELATAYVHDLTCDMQELPGLQEQLTFYDEKIDPARKKLKKLWKQYDKLKG